MKPETVSDVLSNLALDICQGKDGSNLSEYDAGVLATIAEIADRLDLSDAEQFRKLSNTARKGFVKDITAAALRILTE